MNRNATLSPLPFYQSIDEQGFRQKYAYGVAWPLYAPFKKFLPFQILHQSDASITINDVSVIISNVPGTIVHEVTDLFLLCGLQLKAYNGYYVLVFPANVDMEIWQQYGLDFNNDFALEDFGGAYTEGLHCGYLTVTISGATYYSEVMTLIHDEADYVKLEWTSMKDIIVRGGRMVYEGLTSEYVNRLYLRSMIGMPEYRSDEEGEERNGFSFPTFQSSEKVYRFGFTATEPTCDALRLVGMSDVIRVTDTLGRVYYADKFISQVTWNPQGYIADVSCEFETDTVVVQACRAVNPNPAIYDVNSGNEVTGQSVSVPGDAISTLYLRVTPNLLLSGYEKITMTGTWDEGSLTISTNPDAPGIFQVRTTENLSVTRAVRLIFSTVIGDTSYVEIIQPHG